MPTPSQHAFSEKVTLISDGTNPIGRAVAMQLALYGSYVIVGYPKSSDEDRRALEELKSLGTLASGVEAEISTVAGTKYLIDEVDKIYGRLDLLINCLNFRNDSSFIETTQEMFDEILNSNLKSSFFLTQEAMRLMKPRPKPKIVNVFSAVDTEETEKNIAFASANQALIGMTKSLANTLPNNFRVNGVAVSEKENKISENLDAELFRQKKGIDADDVARTVLYLLSSEAIGLNGQIIEVG